MVAAVSYLFIYLFSAVRESEICRGFWRYVCLLGGGDLSVFVYIYMYVCMADLR